MTRLLTFFALLAAAVQSSPTPDILERDYATGKLPDVLCNKVNVIVRVLKVYRATPFCSSYLGLPAVTSTSTVTATSVTTAKVTSTVTAPTSVTTVTSIITLPGTVSTIFVPGNPPATAERNRDQLVEERDGHPHRPSHLDDFGEDIISTGCQCLSIPIKTVLVSRTKTATSTATASQLMTVSHAEFLTLPQSTITTTTTPISTSTVTSTTTGSDSTTTLYPCATPLPILVPTIPYGNAVSSTDLGIQNTRFELSDERGASAEACCNTCYFGIPNCIQAYFYSYQGCVVQQAFNPGSGVGVSSSCPSGLFTGLTYTPDTNPAFRSTGDFAGPCGVRYNNF